MNIDVHIIQAFSQDGRGGNGAGVVLGADALSEAQMQQVAAQVGLSETAFASASRLADIRLDFFTPTRRIAHCGHATIGTFSYLRQQGRLQGDVSSKETVDGLRAIRFAGHEAYMEQSAPRVTVVDPQTAAAVRTALAIPPEAVAAVPEIINTGNGFLLVELSKAAELAALVPDQALVRQLSEHFGLVGFYVFVRGGVDGLDAVARMFAPAYGIDEEAATGMAAGPLGCYLWARDPERRAHYRIGQGYHLKVPSPSLLQVTIESDASGITRVFAGGTAYRLRTLTVAI
ncbi:PhzF family phenazine biosynthesis protein [Flaviaesturariibacter amylovorans]|uniref:PhzF family phenazine biosynthesis protein n=1 Tax=Flaviaesturariibacter amylovorans TaxID=1084520 RepID=A0ABP8GCJ1_9BACT